MPKPLLLVAYENNMDTSILFILGVCHPFVTCCAFVWRLAHVGSYY